MFKSKTEVRKTAKERKRKRIRKKISGTLERPRVYIWKSNRYIYGQVINDEDKKVLLAASTVEKEFREKNKSTKNTNASKALGELLAKKMKQKKIKKIVFDRGVYPYHGRIKTIAEVLRKEGVVF